jgi:hypothetical protein
MWIGISVSDNGPNLVFDFVIGYSSFLYSLGASSTELSVRVNLVAGFFAGFLFRERTVSC